MCLENGRSGGTQLRPFFCFQEDAVISVGAGRSRIILSFRLSQNPAIVAEVMVPQREAMATIRKS